MSITLTTYHLDSYLTITTKPYQIEYETVCSPESKPTRSR
jgi:hypothetical protein